MAAPWVGMLSCKTCIASCEVVDPTECFNLWWVDRAELDALQVLRQQQRPQALARTSSWTTSGRMLGCQRKPPATSGRQAVQLLDQVRKAVAALAESVMLYFLQGMRKPL
jgi:hypothetical protein